MANTTNILSKLKQKQMDGVIDSILGPVVSVQVINGGTGYQNTDTVVFTRSVSDPNDSNTASATVETNANGVILSVDVISGGAYSIPPSVTITSATGTNAVLSSTIDTDSYYFFFGRSQPYNNDTIADPVTEDDFDAFRSMYDQAMVGVKLDTPNFNAMAPLYVWQSNTVYAEFDDADPDIKSKQFYVLTSNNKVFKCIYNNLDAPSTVEPTNFVPSSIPTTLSDGYKWMYLYSVSSSQNTAFMTQKFMPVFQEANVAANTIAGSIQNIKVTNNGNGYPTANGTILFANNGTILLSSNVVITPNFYANCTLTVFGNNNLITNRAIISSSSNNGTQQIKIANTFNANQISAGYSFQIGPTIKVLGDGSGFDGYCTMNQITKSVVSINVINPGNSYNYANVAIISSAGFGNGATARAVFSPPGGHGSDVRSELYSEWLGVSGNFSNAVADMQQTLTFRTIGLLKNPMDFGANAQFAQTSFNQVVSLGVANTTAKLLANGEYVYGQSSGARAVVVSCNSSVAKVTGWNGSMIVGENIAGANSGAVFTINSVDSAPSLKLYSGEILYLNNILPAVHSANASETFKLVLKL